MTNSLVGYVGAVPVYLSLVIIGHWSFVIDHFCLRGHARSSGFSLPGRSAAWRL